MSEQCAVLYRMQHDPCRRSVQHKRGVAFIGDIGAIRYNDLRDEQFCSSCRVYLSFRHSRGRVAGGVHSDAAAGWSLVTR
eukprot:4630098-Prymnesium_polylepis.1